MTVTKKTKSILNITTVLIGMVYLVSGFSKAIDIKYFYNIINDYGFEQLSSFAPIIVIFEIALAVALILHIKTKTVALISCVTLVLFTLLYTYANVFRSIKDCGCFGGLGNDIPIVWMYVRNLIMFLLSMIVFIFYPQDEIILSYKKQVFFFTLLISSYLVGFTYSNPIEIFKIKNENFTFDNESFTFEGMNIHKTPMHKYTSSTDSTYLMYFFSYTCPHCLNSIENLKQYKASNFIKNVILIGTGDESARKNFYKSFDLDFPRFDIKQEEMLKITKKYPISFFVVNDTIKKTLIGTLPVHQNLRQLRLLE